MLFEQIADMDSAFVEFCGFLGYTAPKTKGFASLVGIREQNDPVIAEWGKRIRMKHRLAARCHPDIVGEEFGEYYSALLAFNYGDFSARHS